MDLHHQDTKAPRVVLVLGASPNADRYAHKAVLKLSAAGFEVIAVGGRAGMIGSTPIRTGIPPGLGVDTVTLYLSAANQGPLEEDILGLGPRRIIFNPGAENPSLAAKAAARGILAQEACTLVLLATNAF